MQPIKVTPRPESNANVPLYSARAIQLFSILFSAIVGGILTAQNLRDVGQPGPARKALWGGLGYTVLLMGISSFLPEGMGGSWLPFVVGYAGALGLEAYFKQFVANREDYPAKKVIKPLLICLAIFVPLTALIVYALVNEAT